MSTQYDIQTPVDLLAVGNITKTQLDQAINKIKPLTNIGFFIIMDGGGGTAHPDVTNNPRFTRYGWIDIHDPASPILKFYTGAGDTYANWVAQPVADSSITAVKLSNYAVSLRNATNDPKVVYNQDGTGDATKAAFVLRLDSAGRYVEVASFASMLATQNIDPAKITPGSASQVLITSPTSGLPVWSSLSAIISVAVNSLALNTLQYGPTSPGYILRYKTSGTYEVEAVSNDDSVSNFIATKSIIAGKLSVAGLAAKYGLRYNSGAGNWEFAKIVHVSADTAMAAVNSRPINAEAHGLGGMPDSIELFLVRKVSSADGYTVGDIIPANFAFNPTSASPMFAPVMDNAGAVYSVAALPGAAGDNIKLVNGTSGVLVTYANQAAFYGVWNIRAVLKRLYA